MKQFLIKIKDGKKGLYGEIKMRVPDCWGWSGPTPMECKKCIVFTEHLSSLPFVAFAEALPNKEGDIVNAVVDFQLQRVCAKQMNCDCAPNTYCQDSTWVAIPISNEKEETKATEHPLDFHGIHYGEPKEETKGEDEFSREQMIEFASFYRVRRNHNQDIPVSKILDEYLSNNPLSKQI